MQARPVTKPHTHLAAINFLKFNLLQQFLSNSFEFDLYDCAIATSR